MWSGAVVGVIHVLDIAQVREESLEDFLRILLEEHVPGARGRGLRVEGLWRTPPEAGPPSVTVLWSVDSWEAWAHARAQASRDPSVADCARRLRALTTDASRRFLVPADGATPG